MINKLTNEEKARELAIKSTKYIDDNGKEMYNVFVEAALQEMAEWKDKQAIEYLYKNIQSLLKDYGVSEASADIVTQLFLANFKKAMEE